MKRIALFVEGHGEVRAAENLVTRVARAADRGIIVTQTRRWKNLHRQDGLAQALRYGQTLPVDGLLFLRDEDDACPRATGPRDADVLRSLEPRLPSAVVLMHREYEVVFLPQVASLAGRPIDGRPGLLPSAQWTGHWESRRDIKGWLTSQMPHGRAYKPTLDQLPLTQMLDIEALLRTDVPCIGTLVRALQFLTDASSGTYPPAPPD